MKRTVYICGLYKYPRGNATANYMQYMADVLMQCGYKVVHVCTINTEYSTKSDFEYRGARVIEVMHKGPIHLLNRVMNGKLFRLRLYSLLNRLNISENDLVISTDAEVIREPVLRLQKKKHFKTCGYIAEWFDRSSYENSQAADKADKQFYSNGDLDLIFPISHHIAEQFKERRARVAIVPIMADSREYPIVKKAGKPYQIILPAMGTMKDSLENMMIGLSELDDEELASITFHLTGIKEDAVRKILGSKWDKVEKTLKFYSWLQYEDLIKLYEKCHYLFLARDINRTTLSNFPSKVPETMTHGIVPVCSNVGDYAQYYLKDGIDSIVFQGCSSEACREALRRAIHMTEDEYQTLSDNARKCVKEKFDYRNWVGFLHDNIEAVFQ